DVDRLMDVMRMQQELDAMWLQVEAMQAQMLDRLYQGELDAEAKAEVRAKADRHTARTREALAWEQGTPRYRAVSRQTRDAADVQAMIEFYSSPAGQRVLDKTPQLMANIATESQQLLMPLLQEMAQDLQNAASASSEGDPAT